MEWGCPGPAPPERIETCSIYSKTRNQPRGQTVMHDFSPLKMPILGTVKQISIN